MALHIYDCNVKMKNEILICCSKPAGRYDNFKINFEKGRNGKCLIREAESYCPVSVCLTVSNAFFVMADSLVLGTSVHFQGQEIASPRRKIQFWAVAWLPSSCLGRGSGIGIARVPWPSLGVHYLNICRNSCWGNHPTFFWDFTRNNEFAGEIDMSDMGLELLWWMSSLVLSQGVDIPIRASENQFPFPAS